jgi:hypothetical protein
MELFDAFDSSSKEQTMQQGFNAGKDLTKKGIKKDTKYTEKGVGELQAGKAEALPYLDQGAAQGSGYYDQAAAPFQGMTDRGQAGVDEYTRLLNDPNSFSLTPGAQFQMDTGIEALNRSAAGRGMLQSGNQTEDILRLGQGVANQDYYNNLQARQPYFGLYGQGAQGQSNALMGQGNMWNQLGRDKSAVATGTAGNVADMYGSLGGRINQSYGNLGQSRIDLGVNQANAQSAADSNLWGAILGLGGAAASAYGA